MQLASDMEFYNSHFVCMAFVEWLSFAIQIPQMINLAAARLQWNDKVA
jgi:hypothetical protein